MNTISNSIVGVDVSKAFLDVYFTSRNEWFKIKNTQEGIENLLKKILKNKVKKIAFESSGGYEYLLQKILIEKKYEVWCIDPKRIKAYTRSKGIKAKTDRIDARMIAEFAEKNEKNYTSPILLEGALKLKSYMQRRVDLSEIIAVEKKRMNHPKEIYTKEFFQKHIAYMQQQIEHLDECVFNFITQDNELKKKFEIIKSAPGIGDFTAAVLVSFVPEIGLIEGKKIAALVGVVPYTKQSGTYQGKEKIQEGRFIPRKALYMAALSTIQTDTIFGKFYAALIARKKPPKVALVATMHKIILVINAMVRKKTFWKA